MLHDEAMIVRLSISQWSARKCDTTVTAETAARYQADRGSGRWNKSLVARESLHDITQVVSAARTFHYQNTLPWDDSGGRMLPSKNFLEYSKRMREFRNQFDQAVKDFLSHYDDYRDEARRRLNGMFNPTDYPARSGIESKFGFATEIEPVPNAEDFRVSLQSTEAKRIKTELEQRVQQRVCDATKDLYMRLNDVVGKVAEKLSAEDAIFRDSLVENVVDLVNLLPRLNVGHDPKLTEIANETKRKLGVLKPDALRKDANARSKAADDAKAILDKMSGYLGR